MPTVNLHQVLSPKVSNPVFGSLAGSRVTWMFPFTSWEEKGQHFFGPVLGAGQRVAARQVPDQIGRKNLPADGVHIVSVETFVHSLDQGQIQGLPRLPYSPPLSGDTLSMER